MKTTSLRARALAYALLTGTALCGLTAAPASAQTPREHRSLDSNGVDLTHGDFVMAFVEGSIGSGEGELALVRSKVANGSGYSHVGAGGHQWDGIFLTRAVGLSGTSYSIIKDNRIETFGALGTRPTGSSLAAAGADYHYRTSDGTLIVFADPSGSASATSTYCNGSSGQGTCSLIPHSITSPDGKTVLLSWELWTSCEDILVDSETQPNCSYWVRLTGVTNSFGYRIAYSYASDGNSGVGTQPPPDSWQRRTGAALYNDRVSTTAPQATTAYSYPSSSSVDVTDTGGRQWRFTGNSLVTTGIRRPGAASDTTTIAYSGVGSSVSSVTRDGVTTQYSRSVSGTTATMTVTNALSQSTTIVSDLTKGRPTSVTNPLSQTTGFQYDSANRLTRVTAPEGNYVEHEYDARGNVTKTVAVPKSGSGPTIVTSASFDETCANPVTCNQPNSTTDARGNVTVYTYDPGHGGVTKVTSPEPTPNAVQPETRYFYTLTDGEHRLTGISQCRTAASCADGPDEVKTALAYDPNGNLYWTATGDGTGALVAETRMTYDSVGNLRAVDGPLPTDADTSRTDYNGARQPTFSVSPDPDGASAPLKPRAVRRTYNSSTGLLEKVEQGNVDSLSDPAWGTFSAAQAVETEYDVNGRPVVSKLASGSTVHSLSQTRYDSLGRPECSAQRMNKAAFGTVTATSACALGPQGSGADDHGPDRISRNVYDAAGRVTQVQTALGTADAANEVTKTFTANGQVETVTDGEGNKTTYEYDGHDRPIKTYYPMPNPQDKGSSNASDFEEVTYESLAGGARTSPLVVAFRNRGNQTVGFVHDALGRQTSKILPGSEPDVAYSYDLLGQLTSASRPGYSLGFTYDALGRVLDQTGPLGTVASEWDLAGRRTKLTWPDTFNVTYDHLVTGETTAIRENGAASGIGVLAAIAYDDLGRRKSLTLGNGVATNYAYDAASRLAELKLQFAAATNNLTSSFTYNPAGQIARNERSNDAYSWTGHGSGTTSTTANGLNQIAGWVTAIGHDPKGNIVTDGTYTYGYSSENLLTSLANSATGATQSNIAFSYDPLMRLASIDSTVSAFDVEFGYDGQEMVLEALSAGRTRRYVHGPGVDEPLVAYLVTPGFGTTRNWYQADERGSIVRLSTDTGPGTIGRYDEYGAGGTGRYRYTGQYWLGEANLLYYRARIYDARLGRFLQPDPIGYGDGMNMYAYVGGDPVNFNDPTGLTCVSWREGGGVSEGPGGITVTAGKLVSGCWSDGGGGGPTRYFDGGGGGGGGGGEQVGPEEGKLCPPVNFTVTGIAPGQADGPQKTAISQVPGNMINPNGGSVAINPENFGVPNVRGARREVFMNVRLYPDWDNAVGPSYVPAIPPGLPSRGPYGAHDVIPKDQRHSGNQIDLYRYADKGQAFRSTRTVPLRALIPNNREGIKCPK